MNHIKTRFKGDRFSLRASKGVEQVLNADQAL